MIFTRRQIQIIGLLAEGFTHKQIAYELQISESTMRSHMTRMIERTTAKNGAELVAIAFRTGCLK